MQPKLPASELYEFCTPDLSNLENVVCIKFNPSASSVGRAQRVARKRSGKLFAERAIGFHLVLSFAPSNGRRDEDEISSAIPQTMRLRIGSGRASWVSESHESGGHSTRVVHRAGQQCDESGQWLPAQMRPGNQARWKAEGERHDAMESDGVGGHWQPAHKSRLSPWAS